MCHGSTRLGEPELGRVEAQHLGPGVAERRERAGRAAELGGEPLVADAREPCPRVEDPVEPARGLQPERRRHRLLEQRPAGHRRVAVHLREERARPRDTVELVEDEPEPRCARRASPPCRRRPGSSRREWTKLAAVAADLLPQRPHERLGRIADGPPLLGQLLHVVAAGVAALGDRRRRLRRDHARRRLGRGERPLGLEHRLEPGLVRDRVPELGRHEDARERGHCSKKTVAPSPCMRISKRNPSPSAFATSVSRCAGSRPASTSSPARRRDRRASARAGASRGRRRTPRGSPRRAARGTGSRPPAPSCRSGPSAGRRRPTSRSSRRGSRRPGRRRASRSARSRRGRARSAPPA